MINASLWRLAGEARTAIEENGAGNHNGMIFDSHGQGEDDDRGLKKNEEEVMVNIFSTWAKRAVVDCLQNCGLQVDISKNKNLDSTLTSCLTGVTRELIVYYSQYLSEE